MVKTVGVAFRLRLLALRASIVDESIPMAVERRIHRLGTAVAMLPVFQ